MRAVDRGSILFGSTPGGELLLTFWSGNPPADPDRPWISEPVLRVSRDGERVDTVLMLPSARAPVAYRVGDVFGSYGWVASDLNPEGTVGEAHLATREKGTLTCEHQVAGFITLLRQVRDTSIGGLSPTRDGRR